MNPIEICTWHLTAFKFALFSIKCSETIVQWGYANVDYYNISIEDRKIYSRLKIYSTFNSIVFFHGK